MQSQSHVTSIKCASIRSTSADLLPIHEEMVAESSAEGERHQRDGGGTYRVCVSCSYQGQMREVNVPPVNTGDLIITFLLKE